MKTHFSKVQRMRLSILVMGRNALGFDCKCSKPRLDHPIGLRE